MKTKLYAILVTLIGILLVLPLIGINSLGSLTEGITAWIIAISVLIIGVTGIIKSFKDKTK